MKRRQLTFEQLFSVMRKIAMKRLGKERVDRNKGYLKGQCTFQTIYNRFSGECDAPSAPRPAETTSHIFDDSSINARRREKTES